MTPEQLIFSFCSPLRHGDLDADVCCHVTASKMVRGDSPISDAVPLNWMLLERFDDDYHFTQYCSSPAVRCLKANADKYALEFRFAAFDLDFAEHHERPTREDFADLIRTLFIRDHVPNVCYETRGGARLIYLIEPVRNAQQFEDHYSALLRELNAQLSANPTRYRLDQCTRDWPRLFRCSLVQRDYRSEYDRLICLYHTDTLDLRTFKPASRPKRKVIVGNQRYNPGDLYLLRLLYTEMRDGNRNNATFKAICYAYRTYAGEAHERWVSQIYLAAVTNNGLDESEFDAIHRSARQIVENSRT